MRLRSPAVAPTVSPLIHDTSASGRVRTTSRSRWGHREEPHVAPCPRPDAPATTRGGAGRHRRPGRRHRVAAGWLAPGVRLTGAVGGSRGRRGRRRLLGVDRDPDGLRVLRHPRRPRASTCPRGRPSSASRPPAPMAAAASERVRLPAAGALWPRSTGCGSRRGRSCRSTWAVARPTASGSAAGTAVAGAARAPVAGPPTYAGLRTGRPSGSWSPVEAAAAAHVS